MRRQRIAKQHTQVELFPFLSILACTIGTLILLIIVLTTQALSSQEVVIVAKDSENGSNVAKTPRYIECRSTGLILYPGEISVPVADIDESSSALRSFIEEVKANRDSEYIIMTLRPNAIDVFNRVRQIIENENIRLGKAELSLIDIGYEPIDAGWTLKVEEGGENEQSSELADPKPAKQEPLGQ